MSALLAFHLIFTHKHSTLSSQSLYTIEAVPNTQSHPTDSFSLLIPSEELIAIHLTTPVIRVILPCFCDGDQIIAVLLYKGFQLLLFIAHAACVGVDTLELGY